MVGSSAEATYSFFSPYASSNTSSLYPATELPPLSIQLLMLPWIFPWFSLSEYSSPWRCGVFLAVPYWLCVNQSNTTAKLKWGSPSCKSNLTKCKASCWQRQEWETFLQRSAEVIRKKNVTVKCVQLDVPIRNSPPWSQLVFAIYMVPKPSLLNSLPTQSICFQFRKKEVVGDHTKGLAEIQEDDVRSPFPLK